jgi:molybdenum cofactor guanylyltransferase
MGGINKALLRVGGHRLIERVATVMSRIFDDVILITNSPEEFGFLGFPMFRDLLPGSGSLGGLYTGLSLCEGEWGFFVACDMPFLNVKVIARMIELIDRHDVIVPKIGGRLEPLHAIYSKRCLPHVKALIENRDLRVFGFFHLVDLFEVPEEELTVFDPELRFIMNLNTPGQLEQARRIAQETG